MQTITRQELKAKLDTGDDIKLVMTVGGWTFRAEHIPRSIRLSSPSCALRELRRDDADHPLLDQPAPTESGGGVPRP